MAVFEKKKRARFYTEMQLYFRFREIIAKLLRICNEFIVFGNNRADKVARAPTCAAPALKEILAGALLRRLSHLLEYYFADDPRICMDALSIRVPEVLEPRVFGGAGLHRQVGLSSRRAFLGAMGYEP
jgi:hypothetical protein